MLTSHSMQAIVNAEPPGQGGEVRLVHGEARRIIDLLPMCRGQRPPSADANSIKVCWNSSRCTSGSVTSLSLSLSQPILRSLSLISGIAGAGARSGGGAAQRTLTVVVCQHINALVSRHAGISHTCFCLVDWRSLSLEWPLWDHHSRCFHPKNNYI